MAISVYIDNNVWDFLFARQLDLAIELPRDEFCICITREAEFEIPPIPIEKSELKRFIEATIDSCGVQTDFLFGFNDENLPPEEQRVGGFGIGRFATNEEIAFFSQQRTPINPKKNLKTKLFKNEADLSLAARSFHSVVLSLDRKTGPINIAYQQGGNVVFLTDFESRSLSLSDFIKAALK